MITVERYHDFSYGHRVYGHESKCANAHGHNGRVHFMLSSLDLDHVGRVIDFGEIGKRLCNWLEENWDHKFLLWGKDPWSLPLKSIDPTVVLLPFNPTAENLAKYLLNVVGPKVLAGLKGVELIRCRFEETRKCSATCYVEPA